MSHFPPPPVIRGVDGNTMQVSQKRRRRKRPNFQSLTFSGLLSAEFTKPAGTGLMGSQRRTNSRLQTDPDGCLTGRLEFLQSYITHLQGGEGDDRTKEGGRGWKKEGKQQWFSFFSPWFYFVSANDFRFYVVFWAIEHRPDPPVKICTKGQIWDKREHKFMSFMWAARCWFYELQMN